MNFETATAARVAGNRNVREQKNLRFTLSALERKENTALRLIDNIVSECQDELRNSNQFLSAYNMHGDDIDDLMKRLHLHRNHDENPALVTDRYV